jgi:glyoxylase-like metal-dependent hydrolase (beta-lactamase superfamily II)
MDSDDYTGHVEPGGAAIHRTVEVDGRAIEIRKLSVGEMDNNVYLLRDVATDRALLIDAADDAERILAEVGDTTVEAILTTHGHWDHHRALIEVADATGATVVHHLADGDMAPRQPDRPAEDGATVAFGGAGVRLLHTPGHTPGSVCALLGDRHLFTGDTLFPGGPGNTFGDAEAFATIIRSLQERLFVLDDETWVYPGHGDDTTLGAERPSLPEWRDRGW